MTRAELLAHSDTTLYTAIPACVSAVLLTSPDSGKVYRVEVSGRCNCPAGQSGRLCKHVKSLESRYGSVDAAIADLTKSEMSAYLAAHMPVAETVVAVKRPRISEKTRNLDFG